VKAGIYFPQCEHCIQIQTFAQAPFAIFFQSRIFSAGFRRFSAPTWSCSLVFVVLFHLDTKGVKRIGTRINYELVENEKEAPAVILYSNSSHPSLSPKMIFTELARSSKGFSSMVESLLQLRYASAGGNHLAGDRMFGIDPCPDDREEVARVRVDKSGVARIVSIKCRPEAGGQPPPQAPRAARPSYYLRFATARINAREARRQNAAREALANWGGMDR